MRGQVVVGRQRNVCLFVYYSTISPEHRMKEEKMQVANYTLREEARNRHSQETRIS